MRRALNIALGAATVVAALGVSGCGRETSPPASLPLIAEPAEVAQVAPQTDPGPLPPPEVLSGVISRLADPAVPGPDKLGLVANATPPDAGALDTFAAAMRDAGFTPATVRAADIRWLSGRPGDVVATITVTGPDTETSAAKTGEFSFPMEFQRIGDGWQLTRETAEMLLAFGNARSAGPGVAPPTAPTTVAPSPTTPPR